MGIRATGSILEARSETRVVMLTAFSDRDRVVAALDAGAIGYLLKDSEPQEVLEAVRAAARGDAPLAPRAARQLLAARSEEQRADLSKREREVLALVAEGLPNKLIARRLEISEKTVKTHLTSVFQRIGVSDRTQAALWAQRQGFGTSEQG
jgi:DNA-binding NarL/FixJ family response regulator